MPGRRAGLAAAPGHGPGARDAMLRAAVAAMLRERRAWKEQAAARCSAG
jgi:hypothetical protein